MKIIHHIRFNEGLEGHSNYKDPVKSRREFAQLGIEITPPCPIGLMTGQAAEDHPHWPEIEKLIQKYSAASIIYTEFSREDLLTASHVMMRCDHPVGNAQPEEDDGPTPKTYDLMGYCTECGFGLRQNNPFRIKKDPGWGKYSAMTLHIPSEEIFLKPEVWEKYFKPEGIPCRPVILHGSGNISDKVVQLDVSHHAELDLEGVQVSTCGHCSHKKYFTGGRGYFPRPLRDVDVPIFKSTQGFGHGETRVFRHPFLISNAFYRKLADANLKGLVFEACKPK